MYKKKYSGWLKHADFLILDIIVLQLSFYVAYCIRHGIGNMYADQLYAGMAIVLLLIDIVIGIIFENLHNVMKRWPVILHRFSWSASTSWNTAVLMR